MFRFQCQGVDRNDAVSEPRCNFSDPCGRFTGQQFAETLSQFEISGTLFGGVAQPLGRCKTTRRLSAATQLALTDPSRSGPADAPEVLRQLVESALPPDPDYVFSRCSGYRFLDQNHLGGPCTSVKFNGDKRLVVRKTNLGERHPGAPTLKHVCEHELIGRADLHETTVLVYDP